MLHRERWWVAALAALTVVGCSGIPRHQEPEQPSPALERYLPFATAPIDRFTWLGRFDSWQSLDQTHLVVWTSPNNAYLLTVWNSCIDLPFAQRIGVTSTSGTVSARLDSVLVHRQTCPISEIRPIDYKAMKEAMRAKKAAS